MHKQFTLRFDDAVYAKIKQIAKAETRSVSNLIQHLCQLKIQEYEREHGRLDVSEEELSDL